MKAFMAVVGISTLTRPVMAIAQDANALPANDDNEQQRTTHSLSKIRHR